MKKPSKPKKKKTVDQELISPEKEESSAGNTGFLFDLDKGGDSDAEERALSDSSNTEVIDEEDSITDDQEPADEEAALTEGSEGSTEQEIPTEKDVSAVDPMTIIEEALVSEEESDEELTLAYFASRAYLEYAISVVKDRAIPDVSDGQKPVQRRILYAMKRMGLTYNSKQVKSARIVGDVLGKYHPHGDSAAYDAMVRMAQDFTLRYPLVDGQGNFGSADGDGAAHMRYTEARLSQYADLLLDELDQGSTVFKANYDGAFEEPELLPARLPFLLLNGASGIAVGLATEIPSHNMREVADAVVMLINKPNSTLDDVLQVMPAPDFPGGAQIISSQKEIRNAYETGYGTIKLRARYHFEELTKGNWQLVVTELPYKIGAQVVLSEIESLTNPKPAKGRSKPTAQQLKDKAFVLSMLDVVRDESDKINPVRLVFEPKTRAINRDEFLSMLLVKTSLETNCKFNTVAIGIDGKPCQKGLLDILAEWITFRLRTVTMRLETRLKGVLERTHLLEGRLIIILDIENVIRLVREAKDPKAQLMKTYSLTDEQAEDILELKLRQLASLDEIKLQKEVEKLKEEEQDIIAILNNENKLRKLVASEVKADAKKYGDERRTLVKEASSAVVEQKITDEPVTVIISEKGFLRARTGHNCDPASMNFKLGDSLKAAFECRTVDPLVVLSELGQVYTIPVSDLPGARGDGTHINSFIQLQPNDRPISYFAGSIDTKILLSSTEGMGLVCTVGNLLSRNKSGKTFFTVGEGFNPLPLRPFTALQCWLATLSNSGRLLVFNIEEVRSLPSGGKGVELMQLMHGESLVATLPVTPNGFVVCGLGRGNKPQEQTIGPRLIEDYRAKRRRKGKSLNVKWKLVNLQPSKLDERIEDKKANAEVKSNGDIGDGHKEQNKSQESPGKMSDDSNGDLFG